MKNFYFLFFGLFGLHLAKNAIRMTFFNFFWEYSNPNRAETVLKTIFFFFFGLSRPILARNAVRMTLFNFFYYFFGIFLGMHHPRLGRNDTRKDFFFLFFFFCAYLSLVWIEMQSEWRFLIFWIFLGML